MSAETTEWLNTYTLQSRAVWHTSSKIQQLLDKPTVYDGPIPVADVKGRLFNWEPVMVDAPPVPFTLIDDDGVGEYMIPSPNRKAIGRPPHALSPDDPGEVFTYAALGYKAHGYSEALVDNVEAILDDSSLMVVSAGLLRGGAVAWMQVSVPEDTSTPEGVTFRPYMLAATSLDKSLATTYKTGFRVAVCDNTLSAAIAECSPTYKIRHSSGSDLKIAEARSDLQIQFQENTDAFSAAIADLNATTVTDAQFDRFLESIAPTTDKDGLKTGAAATRAKNKQDEIRSLYRSDPRCEPWKGTAFGVIQTMNTYGQHVVALRDGTDRDERNMEHDVFGRIDKSDVATLDALTAVLA